MTSTAKSAVPSPVSRTTCSSSVRSTRRGTTSSSAPRSRRDGTPSGLRLLFPNGMTLFDRVYNYAGKLTWKINDKHQIESSVFGDPTNTNIGENDFVLNTPNTTAMSKLHYGTRNWVIRYNGTLSPTWLVNGSFTWSNNRATEYPLNPDVLGVVLRPDARHISNLQGLRISREPQHRQTTRSTSIPRRLCTCGVPTRSAWAIATSVPTTPTSRPRPAAGSQYRIPMPAVAITPVVARLVTPVCPLGQTVFLWSGSIRPGSASCTLCPLYDFGERSV